MNSERKRRKIPLNNMTAAGQQKTIENMMETAEISPAQVSMPLREPQQVGQLPEPKPSLTMIKTSNNQSQQVIPPLTNEPLTDVPLINSANPDNFYVLYSQLNYNVVM